MLHLTKKNEVESAHLEENRYKQLRIEVVLYSSLLVLLAGLYIAYYAGSLGLESDDRDHIVFAIALTVTAVLTYRTFRAFMRLRKPRRLIRRLDRALHRRLGTLRSGQGKTLFLPGNGRVVIDAYEHGWNATLLAPISGSRILHLVIRDGVLYDPKGVVRNTPYTLSDIQRITHIVRVGTVE